MNKLNDWIDTHFDELTSVKTLVFVFSIVLNILLAWGSNHLMVRSDIAHRYINELEEYIGDDLMDTVGSGDAYLDYHSYE